VRQLCAGFQVQCIRKAALSSGDARKSATARRRIGVAYQFRELIDTWQWCAGTPPEVR
jgi:hypothetical protein